MHVYTILHSCLLVNNARASAYMHQKGEYRDRIGPTYLNNVVLQKLLSENHLDALPKKEGGWVGGWVGGEGETKHVSCL